VNFEGQISERARRADALVGQGRAELRQTVLDGHRHGLSQRRIAALTGRSQPEVSRIVRQGSGPPRAWMTAGDAAQAIKMELEQNDGDFALRTLVGAVSDLRGLRDLTEIREFLRRPRPTGDRRWDTLLAAAVARACRQRGILAPAWTHRAPLAAWWFPSQGGGLLAARTMSRTPIDFSRLGIWLDASAFQTA